MVITFSGELHKYLVNRNGQYQLVHSFNFTFHHQQGVTAVVYIPIHSLLIIGSHVPAATGLDNSMLEAEQHGLSLWRILSSFPFYKLITDYEEDIKKVSCTYHINLLFILLHFFAIMLFKEHIIITFYNQLI